MSQVAISGNASGTGVFTIASPNSNSNYTATLAAGTGTVVLDTLAQTLTNKTLTSPTITSPTISGAVMSSMASTVITAGTAVASTSGTSIDFTGIPSWVKQVTILFQGVSTNGTSISLVQLGTSSGVTATGYISSATTPGIASSNQTIGFPVTAGQDAAMVLNGAFVVKNISGNIWVATAVTSRSDNNTATLMGGNVTLAAVLDRVRITTVAGTNTYDAGSINILYQ